MDNKETLITREDLRLFRQEMIDKLEDLEDKLESAFPKDDEGEVDYAHHKHYHKQLIRSRKEFEQSRNSFIKTITAWATIGLVTIMGSSIVQGFLNYISTNQSNK